MRLGRVRPAGKLSTLSPSACGFLHVKHPPHLASLSATVDALTPDYTYVIRDALAAELGRGG